MTNAEPRGVTTDAERRAETVTTEVPADPPAAPTAVVETATGSGPHSDRDTRGPGARTVWATVFGAAVTVALAAAVQGWFAPFVVGLVFGTLTARWRVRARAGVLYATVAALGGWATPLAWRALFGEPVVATGRTVAALAGLPPSGWVVIGATLLIALIQALLGVWVGRTVSSLFTARG
ncbi:hypothetical protein AB0C88_41365 [Streptomyces chartreusis]|uniref:hypothetical protein n=1 Tax=Streptomyces chartreusis TaxID=1969 RepID=UPI0033EB5C2F